MSGSIFICEQCGRRIGNVITAEAHERRNPGHFMGEHEVGSSADFASALAATQARMNSQETQ